MESAQFKFKERFKVAVYSYPLMDPSLIVNDYYEYLGLSAPVNHRFPSPIYIHIPFCDVICPFCLYAKQNPDRQRNSIREYVGLLKKEIELYAQSPYVKSLVIDSIFFGGGTPSALSIEQMEETLDHCFKYLPIDGKTEITWECSAINCNEEKLTAAKNAGVSRVSTGLQTFNKHYRKMLGLVPTVEEVEVWLNASEKVGFTGISVDLMDVLPGQTMAEWEADLKESLAHSMINHYSIYELVPISGTPLYRMVSRNRVPEQAAIEIQNKMHYLALDMLQAAGFQQQTLNEFDRSSPGSKFWDEVYDGYGDNLAFGVSSFGYINGFSYQNVGSIDEYKHILNQGKLPIELTSAKINRAQEMERAAALSIMRSRIDKQLFEHQFGSRFDDAFKPGVERLIGGGYVTSDDRWLEATWTGKPWLRNMSIEFMQSTFQGVSHAKKALAIGKKIRPDKLHSQDPENSSEDQPKILNISFR